MILFLFEDFRAEACCTPDGILTLVKVVTLLENRGLSTERRCYVRNPRMTLTTELQTPKLPL